MMQKNNIYSKIATLRNKIDTIKKDTKNAFYKTNYANINSIEKIVEPIENEVGLTHTFTSSVDTDGGQLLTLTVADTEDGSTLTSTLKLILTKQDMQQLISGHTYGRRGLLVSFYSLEAEDDDGNMVSGNTPQKQGQQKMQVITQPQFKTLTDLADKSGADMQALCKFYNIGALNQLPVGDFTKVKTQLEAKLKQVKNNVS